MEEELHGWQKRLVRGFRWGLLAAVGLTILAGIPLIFGAILLVLALVNGDLPFDEPWPPRIKALIWAVPLYFIAAPIGGMLVGLARGLSRWWLGRRFLGMLASFPGALLTYQLLYGMQLWSAEAWGFSAVFAVIWGGAMSFIPEKDFHRPEGDLSRR